MLKVIRPPSEPGAPAEQAAPATVAAPLSGSATEIEAAGADCERRLFGLNIDYERLAPIKDGACGVAAPIRLMGFDSESAPRLVLEPAPTSSCKMAQSMQRWIDKIVQPKAKIYLHAPVVRISIIAGYDCRPRFGDPSQRLSQHAYANALDIGSFQTESGETIAVGEAANAEGARASFLHEIRDGACQIFGTTLGPGANETHKNHLHLDMADRRQPLCDFTIQESHSRVEQQETPPGRGGLAAR